MSGQCAHQVGPERHVRLSDGRENSGAGTSSAEVPKSLSHVAETWANQKSKPFLFVFRLEIYDPVLSDLCHSNHSSADGLCLTSAVLRRIVPRWTGSFLFPSSPDVHSCPDPR